MKLFKVFFSLFVIAIALYVVSRFFPHTYKVERSIKISKPTNEVYQFMNDFRNWEKWSLWNKQADSTLVYFYGNEGVKKDGRQYFWGAALGEGRFKFDTCIVNKKLIYDLHMHAGEIKAKGTFLFNGNSNSTTLSWLDSGDVGNNPIYRFMIPSKVSSTEKTFDDGLSRIKKLIEGN